MNNVFSSAPSVFPEPTGSVLELQNTNTEKITTYTLCPAQGARSSWYGSSTEAKVLEVLEGCFLLLVVQPDNWDNPSQNLRVAEYILKQNQSLEVPAGFVSAYKAIDTDSKLAVSSNLTQEEEVRFERERWYFDSFF